MAKPETRIPSYFCAFPYTISQLMHHVSLRKSFVSCVRDVFAQGTKGDGKPETRIPKSRYSSTSLYLARDSKFKEGYNDLPAPIDQESYDTLVL